MKTTPIQIAVGLVLTLASVQAQTFTTIKSFGILTNVTGIYPQSTLVQGTDGTLYGTTANAEGNVVGTVFKVQPDGSGFAVLKRFTVSDGWNPQAGLTLSGNTLYGTTYSGGASNCGTVFKLGTDGTGYTVLKNFTGSPDGANPHAALTLSGSTLYGTTYSGGSSNSGTAFKLNTDGTGYTVLKSLIGSTDGTQLQAGLTLSGNTLYGETSGGGSGGEGTVFKLNTDGTGYTVLRNFTYSPPDGAQPWAGLTLSGGTLYGVTDGGGPTGAGTVFKINTNGSGYAVLLAGGGFGGPDGELTLSGSTLYGTTLGTVFKINTDGTGYTVLWNFAGRPDAQSARAGLTLSGSTLYGTTYLGGTSDLGTVFKLNTDGTGYAVLKSFALSDGAEPFAGLTASGNTFYGTTYRGGIWGYGTVFSLNTDGTGYTVLNSFTGTPDGQWPYAEVTLSANTLYGTTSLGGTNESGTVFQLNTDGTAYTVLYNFGGYNDGAEPFAGLTLSGGTLYGTTEGQSFAGTLFKLNTDGTGYTVLKNCTTSDGSNPHAGLTLSGSTLYGTTYYGGSSNYGTVFKLNTGGTSYTVLYNFTNSPDGAYPSALTLSGNTLFGITYSGGSSNYGTVFSLNTDGTGYTVLKNFTGSDGGYEYHWGGLTLSGSTLYGTTYSGGSSNYGTVFKLNADGTGYTVLKNFAYDDGAYPSGALTLLGNTLYGTASRGGSLDEGVVFSLNLAPVLNITAIPGNVVLSWADPSFALQAASTANGVYTNVPGATTPYTNSLAGSRKFFRLIGN